MRYIRSGSGPVGSASRMSAVRGGDCQGALDESPSLPVEERKPCPSCGSLRRGHYAVIHEKLDLRVGWTLKHRSPGFKKPRHEEVVKPDLHRKTGRLRWLTRVIDRVRYRYREHITDVETGDVLRSVDEPLTEHVDRGSVRKGTPKT
jgi:hypothetical protein